MMLSIFAVLIVFIAMPASLGLVQSWNNTVSNEYETYIEFNNKTSTVSGMIGGWVVNTQINQIIYVHRNETGASETNKLSIYDKSLFNDSYYRTILSATDTTQSSTTLDVVYMTLNISAEDVLSAGANKIKVHFDVGKPVCIQIRYQDTTTFNSAPAITEQTVLNSTNQYTHTFYIDPVIYIRAENEEGKNGHFTLQVLSFNTTNQLSPGDTVIFTWQFSKKQGSVATIYTIDNLMFGWGAALILIGFASTPFFNPMSRDVFPLITKMKRSRAAKQAAAKRKRTKRRSSKRSSSRKRRRR